MRKPRVLVFASGTATGGGSGFQKLVEASREGILTAEVVAVVSNHLKGGVYQRASTLGVPFVYFPGPFDEGSYRHLIAHLAPAWQPDFISLSGWLKKVAGLDPRTTFNIHPGPLPDFGGPGMYGHHVHEAVMAAYRRGEIEESAVSMHFVTAEYDEGPVFFRFPVPIQPDDNSETLAARVNVAEHEWQWQATNAVVKGEVHWDGVNPSSLVVPDRPYFVKAEQ